MRKPVISGAVLAGGRGLRMGRPKADLSVRGEPLLLRQLRLLEEAGVGERWVCLAADQPAPGFLPGKVGILRDLQPGLGPISGLERALEAATGSAVMILAVDLPAMTSGFLRGLLDQCADGLGGVPRNEGRLEPLAAVYPKSAWAEVNRRLGRGELAVQWIVRDLAAAGILKVVEVPVSQRSVFVNWNRPEDFSEFPAELGLGR